MVLKVRVVQSLRDLDRVDLWILTYEYSDLHANNAR
jgi:hypothetical protein